MTTSDNNIVTFPCDHLVSPAVFQVKVLTGTKVYFSLKGFLIEGMVVGYFGHMTPDETMAQLGGLLEGGAKPARVSDIGYAVAYFVPNQQDFAADPYVRQVQLLDESEFFLSKEELVENFMKTHYLTLPGDVNPGNVNSKHVPVVPV